MHHSQNAIELIGTESWRKLTEIQTLHKTHIQGSPKKKTDSDQLATNSEELIRQQLVHTWYGDNACLLPR
jgi:hypothetical protein